MFSSNNSLLINCQSLGLLLIRRACDANAVDWDWANEHFRKMLRGNNEMTLEIFKKMVSCKNVRLSNILKDQNLYLKNN